MSTISPVIGAPNSYTAIDEIVVTSETAPTNETIIQEQPKQPEQQPELPRESQPKLIPVHQTTTYVVQPGNTHSPGYIQRALDSFRGRSNSESYSAHLTKPKSSAEATIFGESSHSKSLGHVSIREVPSSQSNLEYNIYGSHHPSVLNKKATGADDHSLLADLNRGYHHAVGSLRHAMGFDKESPSAIYTKTVEGNPENAKFTDTNELTYEKGSYQPFDKEKNTNAVSDIAEKDFPLLI